MAPLIALLAGSVVARIVGWAGVDYVDNWTKAIAVGLAAMFVLTGVAHFVPFMDKPSRMGARRRFVRASAAKLAIGEDTEPQERNIAGGRHERNKAPFERVTEFIGEVPCRVPARGERVFELREHVVHLPDCVRANHFERTCIDPLAATARIVKHDLGRRHRPCSGIAGKSGS